MGSQFYTILVNRVAGITKRGSLMNNFFKLFGIIALVAVMVSVGSCSTFSSVGGTYDPHGFFVSGAKAVEQGAAEIASYSVILGLFDSGYEGYATTVKTAEAEGKQITTVTKFYYFFTKTTAYTK
jgi:hypothetical protein